MSVTGPQGYALIERAMLIWLPCYASLQPIGPASVA